ncbi:MAG: zinc-binding dehydrogenase [Planctomycetaceae bacterium]
MIIRLSKLYGYKTLNVVRRAEQMDELKALGADAVVQFDGQHDSIPDFVNRVREITGKASLKHAIDPVGGTTGTAVIEALSNGGRLLVYGSLSGTPISVSSRSLVTHGIRVEGFWLSRHMQELNLLKNSHSSGRSKS